MKDKLSALIDDQLDADAREQFIDQLLANPDLQKSWTDAHLASEIIRSNRDEMLVPSVGFADRISAALEDEPTVFAPNALGRSTTNQVTGSGAIELNPHSTASSNIHPIGRAKTAPIYALAASLALMAVLMVMPQFDRSDTSTSLASNQATISASINTVADAQEFEALMVEHGEFSGVAALNGLLAYAKVVNSESSDLVQ